jgi:hypothetical protein
MKFAPLLLSLSILVGCSADPEAGERGEVRFAPLLNFPETRGFESPVAASGTLLLALREPRGLISGEDTQALPEARLRVDGPGRASVVQIGLAQFAVHFENPGDYTLVATENGQPLDTLPIVVKEVLAIRPASEVEIRTQGNGDCFVTAKTSIASLVLHTNQTAIIYVVAESAEGEPLSGVLPLLPQSDSEALILDVPLFGDGSEWGNALEFKPSFGLLDNQAKAAGFTVEHTLSGTALRLDVRLSPERIKLECDSDAPGLLDALGL